MRKLKPLGVKRAKKPAPAAQVQPGFFVGSPPTSPYLRALKQIIKVDIAPLEDVVAIALGLDPRRAGGMQEYETHLKLARLHFGSNDNKARVESPLSGETGTLAVRPLPAFRWMKKLRKLPADVEAAIAATKATSVAKARPGSHSQQPDGVEPTALAGPPLASVSTVRASAREENALQTARDVLALIVLTQAESMLKVDSDETWSFLPAVEAVDFKPPPGVTTDHVPTKETLKRHIIKALRLAMGEEIFLRDYPHLARHGSPLKT